MISRACFVLSFVLAASASAQSAQGYQEEPVSPYPLRVASPSAEWVLAIDSTDPQGRGAGRYRMEHDGALAWEAEHPFTLSEVAVADDGVVAGYAWAGGEGKNELVLAVMDASGSFRLKESRTRVKEEIVEFDTLPTWFPEPQALLLDVANDRVIFRVQEKGEEQQGPRWYVHRLSDGERTLDAQPHPMDLCEPEVFQGHVVPNVAPNVNGWRLLPDTDLVVVDWWCGFGVYFTLLDSDLREVWRLEWSNSHDSWTKDLLRLFEASQILDTAPDGAFSVLSLESKERVDLRAVRDPSAKTGWRVDEIRREPFVTDPGSAVTDPENATLGERR